MRAKGLQIAIDGPAGAGKSTVSKMVAQRLGYLYIDTGAMYRAATWLAITSGIDINNSQELEKAISHSSIDLVQPEGGENGKLKVFVDGHDVTTRIRTQEISRLVSPLAANAAVRHLMVQKQRQLACKGSGVVLDGRDIGTVVLPDAEVKVFLTASPEVRAKRRIKDIEELGEQADYESVLLEIKERDYRDSSREVGPLKKAADAVEVNTDNMTVEEVAQTILDLARKKQEAVLP